MRDQSESKHIHHTCDMKRSQDNRRSAEAFSLPVISVNSEFRLGRDQSRGYRAAFQHEYPASQHEYPANQHSLHGRRHSQPTAAEPPPERQSSSPYSADHCTPRHRQIHHPAAALATQLTDLDPTHHQPAPPTRDEMPPVHGYQQHHQHHHQAPRQVQSAGSVQTRQVKPTSYVPGLHVIVELLHQRNQYLGTPSQPATRTPHTGDRVLFTESPTLPGVPIIYRTQEEKNCNPDRLNLDRRRLTICPILEGEDHLRLLNFQHNAISKIEHLSSLRRLIFLDLYNNQIETISGLETLKSLRVLMLGKNRIQTIENLHTLVKLDVLDLHGNRIMKVENLDHLEELRVLNLAGNEITHVDNLCGMDSLTELNFRRNKITTVVDVDTLPSLQRLFLSFNLITSFDDISCLSNSTSLTELSLDGNPFCQDSAYKYTVIRQMNYLRQLDMKGITEEEKRAAMAVVKKEEQKKKEISRMSLLKEKRRLAIKNAARQWEAAKSTAMAKTARLQQAPIYGGGERGRERGRESGLVTPETQESRPGSSEGGSERGHSVDLIEDGRNRESSRPSTRSDSGKRPTPDLLANIADDVCHLAELEGDTLNLYGPSSLEALDKNWGVQAAGSITTVSIKFIDFDLITRHLHKIRVRFPNVSCMVFGECNIKSLAQLNALASLRRLESVLIANEGNPVTSLTLWKQYLLFRLSHLSIKKIDGQPLSPTDQLRADKCFGPLAKLTAEQLPSTRLQMLLGDTRRRLSQPLTEAELKARKQLSSDQLSTPENAGKAGLVHLSDESLASLQQERLSKTDLASSYIQQLTTQAIEADRKNVKLAQVWPRIFITMVHKAVLEMSDLEAYRKRALVGFKNS